MQGFDWLHVVDLNGAFAGESVNGAAVDAILKATKNSRSARRRHPHASPISRLAGEGALPASSSARSRSRTPIWSRRPAGNFPARIAVGIDAKGGKVAVEGWAKSSKLGAIELAKKFEGAGVAAVIYTDIDRDGVLAGINWESTIDLADAVSIPVSSPRAGSPRSPILCA